MSSLWIEAIGFIGSGLAVLTYWMRDMFVLRIQAVAGCLVFIAYGAMIGSYPLLAMELLLLPINAWRLFELQRARHRPIQTKRT
jgi:hypothetical protein